MKDYDDNLYIQIIHDRGTIEVQYKSLLVRPKGMRTREHDAKRRKLIKFASKNGGWKLFKYIDDQKVFL